MCTLAYTHLLFSVELSGVFNYFMYFTSGFLCGFHVLSGGAFA